MKRANAGAKSSHHYINVLLSCGVHYSLTHRGIIMFAVVVFIAAFCAQGTVVFSQQPQQGSLGYQGQGWIPQSWATPYYNAGSNSWMDYLKQAQQISNQFLKQWDKTGASNMFAMGLDYAQQAAKEFEKIAATAAQQPQQMAEKVPFF